MQEIELEPGANHGMLSIKNYCLEVETNSVKKELAHMSRMALKQ